MQTERRPRKGLRVAGHGQRLPTDAGDAGVRPLLLRRAARAAVAQWGGFRDGDGEICSRARRIPAGLPTDGPDTRRRLFPAHHRRPRRLACTCEERGAGSVSRLRFYQDTRRGRPASTGAATRTRPRFVHVTWTPRECGWFRKGRHGCPRHAPSSPACTGICRDMRDAGVAALRRQHLPRLEEHGPRQAGTWPEKSVSTPSTCSEGGGSTRPRVYA